uniref:Inositol-phosphate phosphatase n=1 Tax=Bionectria ochroleuca TaxID=29856 RepID=A0A8H7ND42_BIOOC
MSEELLSEKLRDRRGSFRQKFLFIAYFLPNMADLNLQAIHDELIQVAYEAGKMMLAANPANIDTGTKLNSVDIVTEVDKGVEKMVSTRLSAAFPSISFMGEETYKPGMRIGPEPTFVVDPIDGTTNFIHSFPDACISLGLAIERKATVGVIYNPWQDLLYTAIKGQGAYMTRVRGTAPRGCPWRRPLAPSTGSAPPSSPSNGARTATAPTSTSRRPCSAG